MLITDSINLRKKAWAATKQWAAEEQKRVILSEFAWEDTKRGYIDNNNVIIGVHIAGPGISEFVYIGLKDDKPHGWASESHATLFRVGDEDIDRLTKELKSAIEKDISNCGTR